MPEFNVGDRVQVPGEMHGAELEWLGKQGVVKAISASASGPVSRDMRRAMNFQPCYEVLFDAEEKVVLIDENILRPAGRDE